MAIPLFGLGAALSALKGLGTAGAAKSIILPGAAKAATKSLILPTAAKATGAGMKATAGKAAGGLKRMAGDALTSYLGEKPTALNLATNFGFDAGFGVLHGALTPGDLGDKVIAGTSIGLGSALGGVGAVGAYGKLTGKVPTGLGRMPLELIGGYGGDMAGMAVGDSILRAKGGGTTPWEKVQMDADQERRIQIERETLAALGLGGYPKTDMFLSENGLG